MIEGIIPPLAGKGGPIKFYTDDEGTKDKIVNVFKAIDAAHKKIVTLEKDIRMLQGENENLQSRFTHTSNRISEINVESTRKMKTLEAVFKDMLRSMISLYPDDILSSQPGDDGEPLDIATVVDHWLLRAGIKLYPGETIQRKKIF